MNKLRRWWLEKTTKIVVMTTGLWDGGGIQEYAVRRLSFHPGSMFRYEYLDLSTQQGPSTWHKDKPINMLQINWWIKPEHVLKYCTSSDLELVVKCQQDLFNYVKPDKIPLPTATELSDVKLELAQFKLRGGKE